MAGESRAAQSSGVDYRCPLCGVPIHTALEHRGRYDCPDCEGRFAVLVDPETGRAAFVDDNVVVLVDPLRLPTGSIRALITLAMVASGVAVLADGRELHGPLLSLLLTVIGFYFGFRTKACMASDSVYDPSATRERPLWLPAGMVRALLIAAVCGMGMWLLVTGRLFAHPAYVEFFFILGGLVAGHFYSRFSSRMLSSPKSLGLRNRLRHVKALVGLLGAAAVATLFIAGWEQEIPAVAVTMLCATMTFYFGSRG